MPSKFRPGSGAYAKDGRRYVVEDVEDGVVYCLSDGGAETEFSEVQLFTEAEWSTRTGVKPDRVYTTIRQAPAYAAYKGRLNRGASERLLAKAERLFPGILDFTAFVAAERILTAAGQATAELSVAKCREIFETAAPESRAVVLSSLVGSPPEVLVGAADLGDNLMRAMIEKATTAGSVSFESFRARRGR